MSSGVSRDDDRNLQNDNTQLLQVMNITICRDKSS